MNPEVLILHKPLEHFDYVFARRVVEPIESIESCSVLNYIMVNFVPVRRYFVNSWTCGVWRSRG